MDIPNIFKNRTGAIQLSDLDDNFNIVRVTVNAHDTQILTLQQQQTELVDMINNFSAIPVGCILMWSGSIATIPDGWLLCNGTNGTPDLRDKFVIGARSDSGGPATTNITGTDSKSGGFKDSTVVSHVHGATSTASTTSSVGNDVDSWSASIRAERSELYANGGIASQGYDWTTLRGTANDYNSMNTVVNLARSRSHSHTISVNTTVTTTVETEGVSGTNRNLPPYYSLAFIMKT